MINVDDAKIFVERLPGTGNLNFVLIHNAGSNHQFFIHQLETLRKYGDVIQLDLPGSGKSSTIASYKMSDLSSLIALICKKLKLSNICLIGLNNGANICIETLLNHPLPIKKLILIDPPIFMDSSFVSEINGLIKRLNMGEFDSEYVTSLIDAHFLDTDFTNKKIAMSAFNQTDKQSLKEILKGLLEWDATSDGILKKIVYPTLCILTDEHHCSFKKMHKQAPQFEIGKVVGSKCWATLEVPDQINSMIARFLNL